MYLLRYHIGRSHQRRLLTIMLSRYEYRAFLLVLCVSGVTGSWFGAVVVETGCQSCARGWRRWRPYECLCCQGASPLLSLPMVSTCLLAYLPICPPDICYKLQKSLPVPISCRCDAFSSDRFWHCLNVCQRLALVNCCRLRRHSIVTKQTSNPWLFLNINNILIGRVKILIQ